MTESILVMENITKVYSNGFVANKAIDFSINKGEIHALLGENGAGKSTLMKILFGIEAPDSGQIILDGKKIIVDSPLSAIKYGIGMVHQHFMLVPSLTVAENMILGMEPGKYGLLDMKKAGAITKEVSDKYQLYVDPEARVEDLSVGFKQKIEILKALLRGARILILDEPTAVLTPQETQELFVQLKNLRDMGHTIIFISHKLQEVMSICDRFTVLRLGKKMGTGSISDVTEADISRMMVGRDVVLTIEKEPAEPQGDAWLKIKNLRLKNDSGKLVLDDVSLSVRKGEILAIAGVEGNGQRELSDIITGMMPYSEGSVYLGGNEIKKRTVREIRDYKVAHVSEDRMTFGAVADASILENLVSDRFERKEYNKFGLMNFEELGKLGEELIDSYLIKCDDYDQPVRMLSGGNIQKVVVAREFSSNPELIIANQPTRGIDVGASEFIRKKLVELRTQGTAVLLISADLNEVLELSDSIVVMSGGRIVAYLPDSKLVSEEMLGEYMLGIKTMSPAEIAKVAYV